MTRASEVPSEDVFLSEAYRRRGVGPRILQRVCRRGGAGRSRSQSGSSDRVAADDAAPATAPSSSSSGGRRLPVHPCLRWQNGELLSFSLPLVCPSARSRVASAG